MKKSKLVIASTSVVKKATPATAQQHGTAKTGSLFYEPKSDSRQSSHAPNVLKEALDCWDSFQQDHLKK